VHVHLGLGSMLVCSAFSALPSSLGLVSHFGVGVGVALSYYLSAVRGVTHVRARAHIFHCFLAYRHPMALCLMFLCPPLV